MKNCDISLLFLLTQIVGTQLGAVLTYEYPLSMFLSSKTKGSECPCKLHCLYVRTSVRPYVRPEKFVLHITLKRVVL